MLNSTEPEISTAHRQIKKFLALSLSDVVFIMLINVKMPTIVNIYEQDKSLLALALPFGSLVKWVVLP